MGEVAGLLTLSANSTLDLGSGNAWFTFAGLGSPLSDTRRLSVYNYKPGTDGVYFLNSANINESLNYITFYSDAGTTSLGSGFFSAPQVHCGVVPETSTTICALLLLGGLGIIFVKKRRLTRIGNL